MSVWKRYARRSPSREAWLWNIVLLIGASGLCFGSGANADPTFPYPISHYADVGASNLGAQLLGRIRAEPFNLLATLIFVGAILHTFLTPLLARAAFAAEQAYNALEAAEADAESGHQVARRRDLLQFRWHSLRFLSEVEAVFGIWLVPLFVTIVAYKGWPALVSYSESLNPAEPIFVVAIMAMASSRPILQLAERALAFVASVGGYGPAAWWLVILSVGPLLGSFITEPGAMTICAALLRARFYSLGPSQTLRYATLGSLFVGVSVGGTLSHFAAPPVVMVAGLWHWDFAHMFTQFGWKAALGIWLTNSIYFLCFRRELLGLNPLVHSIGYASRPIPNTVVGIHVLFLAWTVAVAHIPILVIIGFLFYLAFVQATSRHQENGSVRGPLMVGFFLLALIFHGRLQQWWLQPVLSGLGELPLMISATILTGFNDNAAITFLASLVPNLTDTSKYAVMAGAVTGGGLTVIANAPNPVGQAVLAPEFGVGGISALGLFIAALLPTIIVGCCFMLFQ
jgi:Putative Na+/H+ antiporter